MTLWVKVWTPEIEEHEDDNGVFATEKIKPVIHKIEGTIEELRKEINDIGLAGEDGVHYDIIALLDEDGIEIISPVRENWLYRED